MATANPTFKPRSTTTAPSPSPPPQQPPTATAPGPRANALSRIFDDALSHTLRACSYANFAACFPTPATYVPEALGGLHREFVAKLDEMCKSEFEALMDERSVLQSLNDLDALVAEARATRDRAETVSKESGGQEALVYPNPPHLLSPSSLVSAHLRPFIEAQSASLTQRLEAYQVDNRALAAGNASQRLEIEGLLRDLETAVADVQGAAEAVSGKHVLEIRNTT